MSEQQVRFMAFSDVKPPVCDPIDICTLPLHVDQREWFRDYIRKHIEWSHKTFGPGIKTYSLAAHIMKELGEIGKKPTDLEEWIDVIILALDGAWRCGLYQKHSPDQIMDMLLTKQQKNFGRKWVQKGPDEPIEHDRSQEEGS